MDMDMDRNILNIVQQFLAIVFILFRLYTCETRRGIRGEMGIFHDLSKINIKALGCF